MIKRIIVFAVLIILFNNFVFAQSNGHQFDLSTISSFDLKTISANKSNTFHLSNPTTTLEVFIFLSPECPLSKNYILPLNKLFQQYNRQVQFYGCISGKGFSDDEIISFNKTYKILFPLFVDENKKLTNYIAATVTPEVILIDKSGELIYKGAIDDWLEDLGKQKLNASKYYLQDAIDAYLHNKTVVVKETKAYGCFINDY